MNNQTQDAVDMDSNDAELLSQSSGFVNMNGLIGYLPFRAANELVKTGRYKFWLSCAWGYVVRKKA